ncbi:predicted protein [Sclerotinia sclerotiorum 1980 UF-70]|uniref:Uncharacterized protein n=1 Tax=Sclerotinia sclerotiorum (strain ATCC 18683 / 1980 / Ss-1) TaxID=665079 RepID=A7F3Z4_SCLS1|nr:predicted protein [Sclerotinia sclerotiorum 1980 UF-70]EDN97465.1 predicted protein [Sclerotinia sclerotiorum 1980 UF-70]
MGLNLHWRGIDGRGTGHQGWAWDPTFQLMRLPSIPAESLYIEILFILPEIG